MSLNNGNSWTNENIDDDARYIPSSDINFISTSTESNSDIKRAFLIGNSSADSKKAEVNITIYYGINTQVALSIFRRLWNMLEAEC